MLVIYRYFSAISCSMWSGTVVYCRRDTYNCCSNKSCDIITCCTSPHHRVVSVAR